VGSENKGSEEANRAGPEINRRLNVEKTSKEEESEGEKDMEQTAQVINKVNKKDIVNEDKKLSRVNIKKFF
jgi:hypothetical protein